MEEPEPRKVISRIPAVEAVKAASTTSNVLEVDAVMALSISAAANDLTVAELEDEIAALDRRHQMLDQYEGRKRVKRLLRAALDRKGSRERPS